MGQYWVGVGARDVTPPQWMIDAGRIYLWGFSVNTSPAIGVADFLWSRALAVRDSAGTTTILVSIDIGAIDADITERVRAAVLAAAGVPAEYILLNVTHTHSAPVIVALPWWPEGLDCPDGDYVAFLEEQVTGSILDALADLQPGDLALAGGEAAIGANRHFGESGAYDRTLDVLHAVDDDGATRAVAFFHGCHPVLNQGRFVSSDYPGVTRTLVEDAVGGTALFFQGYAGTIDPRPDLFGPSSGASVAGQELADGVLSLLGRSRAPVAGLIDARSLTIDLPLQELSDAALEAAREDPDMGRWVAYMEELGPDAPAVLPTEVQAIRIGEEANAWRLVASAHEVVAELAAPVRSLWGDRITLAGYSNCQRSYLPNRAVLDDPPCALPPVCRGNYEGGWSFGVYSHRAPVTSDVEDLFLEGHEWLSGIG